MLKPTNTVQLDPMQLLAIRIAGFRKIECFHADWTEENDIIFVAGGNGSGKTSAALAVAIGIGQAAKAGMEEDVNAKVAPGKGYDIKLLFGSKNLQYKVHHTSGADGKSAGLTITPIENGVPGKALPNPKEFLRELIGEGPANPVNIMRMQPAERRKLGIVISGVDVDALDVEIKQAKDEVKRLEAQKTAAENRCERLPWHDDAPEAELSAGDLSQKIQQGILSNSEIDRVSHGYKQAAVAIQAAVNGLRADDKTLELEKALCDHLSHLSSQAAAKRVDLEPLQAQMASLDVQNRKYRENQVRIQARVEWEAAEAEVGKATEHLKKCEQQKREKLAAATFPIEGMGYDLVDLTLNGRPWTHMSTAEQIRVSVAISLLRRGAVAFMLIDNGENLDRKSRGLLIAEARAQGARGLCFLVSDRDEEGNIESECHFSLLDGNIAPGKKQKTDGKGGEPAKAPPVRPNDLTTVRPNDLPPPCPTCGGYACGAFCMNGDAA